MVQNPRIHMLHVEEATEGLRDNLQQMRDLLLSMMADTTGILKTNDHTRHTEVIDLDTKVDTIHRHLELKIAELLALLNPMGSDFRFVFSVLKINIDMERIGDQLKNVLTDFAKMDREPTPELVHMAEQVKLLLDKTMTALFEKNTELAREVLKEDAEIDGLELIIMNQSQCSIPETMIARSLERIADHATNVSESIIYAYEGVDVKDVREKHKING